MQTSSALSSSSESKEREQASSAAAVPSSTTLPANSSFGSSPSAQAFFAAFDQQKKKGTRISTTLQDRIVQSLGWRNRYSQNDYYPLQLFPHSHSSCRELHIQQVQRGEVEGTYGTGATVWPAAVVLIKYLEHQLTEQAPPSGNLLRRDSSSIVIDLGSGTGVTSIATALLWKEQHKLRSNPSSSLREEEPPSSSLYVLCTDGLDTVVQLADKNIQRHHNLLSSDIQIDTRTFWWGRDRLDYSELLAKLPSCHPSSSCTNHPDPTLLILVADCVLPKLYPIAPLVEALHHLLSLCPHSQASALLSYEHRYYPDYDPRVKFGELCAARGLRVETIPHTQHHPMYSVDDIELWKVTII